MPNPPKKPNHKFDESWWAKEKEKFTGRKKTRAQKPTQKHYDPYRVISSEYERFNQEPEKKDSLYLKLVKKLAVFDVDPDPDTKEKMGNALRLLQWDITPAKVGAFMILGALITLLIAIPVFIAPIPTFFKLVYFIVPLFVSYYLWKYPETQALKKVVASSEEIVLTVLYLVVFMRSTPNLEGAIRFTTNSLRGPIAQDFSNVLWNVNVGRYPTIIQALEEYLDTWRPYNREFIESLELVIASTSEGDHTRRQWYYDEALVTVLDGTKERMKHFAQNLKTPVTVINTAGIMLPILGMIILPLATIFMGDVVKAYHLFTFYNVLLPFFIYYFIKQTLLTRPPTVNALLAEEKSLPPRNRYTITVGDKKIAIPAILIALPIALILVLWGLGQFADLSTITSASNPVDEIIQGGRIVNPEKAASLAVSLFRSLSVVLGIGIGIALYFYYGNVQRLKKEEEIRVLESEFSVLLFHLGTKVAGGDPIEIVLQKVKRNIGHMKISKMTNDIIRNMSSSGMTFEKSILDSKRGILVKYPSSLFKAVFFVVLGALRKGVENASLAMKTIARYLKNVHWTQETINDLLQETKEEMLFLAYVMAPMISAIAVSMSGVLQKAICYISCGLKSTNTGSSGLGFDFMENLLGVGNALRPEILQLIVGLYLVEMSLLLGYFYVHVSRGNDVTATRVTTGKILLISLIIYAVALIILTMVFGSFIENFQGFGAGAECAVCG